jgi:NAD(P)-dependent dehydrogenase (short-subunit alcohol dehydrogenase family)
MKDKVVVITGATSGIGQVTAESLARMGARIVQIARDPQRGAAALERLRTIAPAADHTLHYADLSRLSEMKRVGSEIAAAELRIDVLINNAGAMFSSRQVTEDGCELTLALNHLAYFVLTSELKDRLLASTPARIVNTASDAHRFASLDFDDLQSQSGYKGFKVYCRSKLCNVLFTSELARRWANNGVTANSLHPGFVSTRFGDQSGGLLAKGFGLAKLFAISPENGAKTLIYLASSPDVASVTGQYYHKCRPVKPSRHARNADDADRLWRKTEELAQPNLQRGIGDHPVRTESSLRFQSTTQTSMPDSLV